MKYTPSFSAMALRTGMSEVKELNELLYYDCRNVLARAHGFTKETLRRRKKRKLQL